MRVGNLAPLFCSGSAESSGVFRAVWVRHHQAGAACDACNMQSYEPRDVGAHDPSLLQVALRHFQSRTFSGG